MTGAAIVAALLRDAASAIGVAAKQIRMGALPEGADLPAILVRTVSSVDRQPLRRGGTVRTTDRVSVTIRAASYRDQVAAIAAIRRAIAAPRTGDIGGGVRVAITTAGVGPDVLGPGGSFEQAQDFRVSFDA